ncbi:hypothetical protein QE152_g6387 [Popillia japonica]|uniref:Uncharacterized protein n=1 Tax=Popillia japonica TaxID=7064 RepID=A0AAW1MII3_POPJA
MMYRPNSDLDLSHSGTKIKGGQPIHNPRSYRSIAILDSLDLSHSGTKIKGGQPIHNPRSYRSIAILDMEDKLFKRLVVVRLKEETVPTGNPSENQQGFKEGRQTVDAINVIIKDTEQAAAY